MIQLSHISPAKINITSLILKQYLNKSQITSFRLLLFRLKSVVLCLSRNLSEKKSKADEQLSKKIEIFVIYILIECPI